MKNQSFISKKKQTYHSFHSFTNCYSSRHQSITLSLQVVNSLFKHVSQQLDFLVCQINVDYDAYAWHRQKRFFFQVSGNRQ
jgi:hypothetical protein